MIRFYSSLAKGEGDFSCTICREEYAITPFEKRTDNDNVLYDLWICQNCHVVLNATHLREVKRGSEFIDVQASSSDAFYAVDEEYLNSVSDRINADTFISFLIEQYPQCPRGVLLDFGAGRGITSGAATKYFEKVYAAELTLNVLQQVHSAMPSQVREKMIVTDDYLSIPDRFDAIISMHTLEHLPNLRDILETLVVKMNPGAALFFQVPLLRKDYLICVHYTFFNEASCIAMANELGLEVVGVWFDTNLDFLTCILRRP